MSDKIMLGSFAQYALTVPTEMFPEDEEAIDVAVEEMLSMCGNPGQERLIGDFLDHFYEWALSALEEEMAYGTYFDAFANMVMEEWYNGDAQKWWGTSEIWAHGWLVIAGQSGFHDSHDELGEGRGQDFSGL